MLSIRRRSIGRGPVVVAILFIVGLALAACQAGSAAAPAGLQAAPGASAGAAGGGDLARGPAEPASGGEGTLAELTARAEVREDGLEEVFLALT